MGPSADHLAILCCPQCQGTLKYASKDHALVCPKCRLCFKTIGDRVDLRLGEASTISKSGELVPVARDYTSLTPVQGPLKKSFLDNQKSLALPRGSCVVVTRSIDRPAHASRGLDSEGFSKLDLQLNENAKKMLANFMGGRGHMNPKPPLHDEQLFGFKRLPDIVVSDVSISKVHCLFFYDEVGLGVFDLFSLNGTYVNGAEVESSPLAQGDIVQFGQSALRVVLPE